MTIKLLPPEIADHKYTLRLEVEGRRRRGRLSPDLTSGASKGRYLALVDLIESQVPEEYKHGFLKFEDQLLSYDARRLSAAKKGVVAIRAEKAGPGAARIAIHRMGPVPAFAVPKTFVSPAQLTQRAEVVVFPAADPTRTNYGSRGSESTAKDLFQSLVVTDPETIFFTYLDEIFEHLKDVSDNLDLPDSFRRIRAIWEIQGQSIATKLEVMCPSVEGWKNYLQGKSAVGSVEYDVHKWFERNCSIVAQTLLLSCLVDRCIDYFFELTGIKMEPHARTLRGQKYDLSNCRAKFCANYDLSMDVFRSSQACQDALDMFSYFGSSESTKLREFTCHTSLLRNLRDFLLFVLLVRKETQRIFGRHESLAHDAVLFVSRRKRSTFGDEAFQALRDITDELGNGTQQVTTFDGLGGEPIYSSVKAQLWISSEVWSLIPEQDSSVGEDLTWIYLEAEHATISGKEQRVWARSRDELDAAVRKMELIDQTELADNVFADRKIIRKRTLSRFSENVYLAGGDVTVERPRLRQLVADFMERSASVQRKHLLEGLLWMLEPNDVAIIALAYHNFGDHRFTRNQFLNAAEDSKHDPDIGWLLRMQGDVALHKAFSRATQRSNRLRFKIGHISYQLIKRIDGTRQYELGLTKIVRALAGPLGISTHLAEVEIMSALQRVLR